jgi:myo-inositol-1(or 4)-monophosphatase
VNYQTLLVEIELITKEAGNKIRSFYRGKFEVEEKSPDNPVTEADKAADTYLKSALLSLLPNAGWLSEETVDSPERLEKEYVWIVDPLDGTKEFVMGIPEFSVSVALVKNGIPVVGAVYNPITDEMVSAYAGDGLRKNGESVSSSERQVLEGAIVDASRSERKRGEFEPFEDRFDLITMGSIAWKLARTGYGAADATWSRGPKHEWDICAGVLLIKEGGGQCVDLDGNEFIFNQPWPKVNGIIGANKHLFPDVFEMLEPYRNSARSD